jgi:hypothetical protein
MPFFSRSTAFPSRYGTSTAPRSPAHGWGQEDDGRYYLNDELVNYWFTMLNIKLNERDFAGTREKNVCLLGTYFLSKLQENLGQCPATARNGRELQLARASLVS